MAYSYQDLIKRGYTPSDINKYVASKSIQTQQPTATQPKQQSQGGWEDYLPLVGSIGGGALGSLLGPLGSIGGSAGGGALGDYIKQSIKGKGANPDIGEIAGEAGTGALGGVAGVALGPITKLVGGLAKGAIGTGLENFGENVAVKSLKPSPSQLTNFKSLTGEGLGKTLSKEGLIGKNPEEITAHLQNVQNLYDSAVTNSGAKVDSNLFRTKLYQEASPLLESNSTDAQRIGKKLLGIADNMQQKYGGKPIDAEEILKDRRLVDKFLPQSAFMGSPVEGGSNKILRDTEKALIDKATGGETAVLGNRLQKLNLAEDIATAGENKGAGSRPLGLLNLLGLSAGGGLGGIPGAAVGYAATNLANSPQAEALIANALIKGGGALKTLTVNPALANIGGKVASQGITRGIGNVGTSQPVAPQPETPTSALPESPSGTATDQGALSPDVINKLAMVDLLTNEGKNLPKLQAFSTLTSSGSGGKARPVTAVTNENLAKRGLRALDQVATSLKADPNAPLKQLIPGQLLTRNYDAAAYQAVEALLRLSSGAAVPEQEVRRYMRSFIPRVGDDPTTIDYKLNSLRSAYNDALTGYSASNNLTVTPQAANNQ